MSRFIVDQGFTSYTMLSSDMSLGTCFGICYGSVNTHVPSRLCVFNSQYCRVTDGGSPGGCCTLPRICDSIRLGVGYSAVLRICTRPPSDAYWLPCCKIGSHPMGSNIHFFFTYCHSWNLPQIALHVTNLYKLIGTLEDGSSGYQCFGSCEEGQRRSEPRVLRA